MTDSLRKADHLRICLEEAVEFPWGAGFDRYTFLHQALPECDLEEVDLSVELFGRRLAAPVIISGMTGGTELARSVNRNLALAADRLGLAMGLGSQRVALEQPGLARTFQVRDVAPRVLLIANLGAVQIREGWGPEECRRALEMVGADALAIHLNPLQEALQPEGRPAFRGVLEGIGWICRDLGAPVLVKEVGYGLSPQVARRLWEVGVRCLDVAGAGGTCWSKIEGRRTEGRRAELARAFWEWGIPTAEAIRLVRQELPHVTLVASGGIRNGLDAAKAIALGADAVALGLPLLKPALDSPEAVEELLQGVLEGLRICMFCVGAVRVSDLRGSPYLVQAWR